MTDASAPTSRIPEFATVEEEAEFWNTHDPSDDREEFRPARVRIPPPSRRATRCGSTPPTTRS